MYPGEERASRLVRIFTLVITTVGYIIYIYILGLYRDIGKENGNYYNRVYIM